ncbi:MAG: hypothetical protein QOG63_2345 [Thermoleophilaceae bacterium]|jgi:hypothetical protein|nr:hypothetical protein [Thermoleophilaceae bacterium]
MPNRPTPQLRASDADRDAAALRLRNAAVEGRIDDDELERRVGEVYSARWMGDLERLTADITPPPPPVPAPPAGPPHCYGPYPPAPETNGMAIASLVAGFLWLGWLGSFAAVVFGHVALSQINESQGRQTGRGTAIAGLVLGYMGVATLVLVMLVALTS